MGSISTGIGLISGINSAQLIDSLIALESRGKTLLQQRVASLNAQRTALMDINARLLNMKNAAKAFRLDRIFESALATSSNEDVLTATAGKGAQPGAYQFIVKQLVTTSQKLSKGYADKTSTPLGLSSLSFEFGHGQLAGDRDLEQLNAGAGVDRGRIIITDKAGASSTIDLTDATTLNEVLDRINAASVAVTASVDGDRLVIADTSGGAGTLTIENSIGDSTATDLGIEGSAAGAVTEIVGLNVNTIGGGTSLASLNDRNGVLIRNNVADFRITARDGTVLDVDLGRLDAPISNSTLLADLNNGDGVEISSDEDNTDIKFVDRNGTTHEVNLTGITTVGGLITRVQAETGGAIVISVNADGERLTVTDTTGGTGTLQVLGGGANGAETAEDLGILNVAGVSAASFDGEIIPNTITNPPAATIQNVIDRINDATGNGGKVVASLAADGVSLLITDTTGGAGNLIIRRTASNAHAASALGIETDAAGVAAATVDGNRLIASLGSVLVNNLNGGAGLSGGDSLTITDRSGASFTINGLSAHSSLSEIIDAVNDAASAASVDVALSLNDAGSGLQVADASGGVGNLTITGTAAAALGIEADVAAASVRGTSLQHQYVDVATRLSDLNYGRGIGVGKFKITDALGGFATIDIGSDASTLYDIIEEINSRGLAINARINDTGDGLLIESALDVGEVAVTKLKIAAVSGSAARDLNIVGSAETVEDGFIDGSYERTVELEETDNLSEVMEKINEAGIPVSASIINSGSGATPYRLNLTSQIAGRIGELVIDSGDVDLGLAALTRGQDAKVFFGSDSTESGLLVTSGSNTITSVIEGVTINLLDADDDPVTITVERDNESILNAVKQLVTTFNDAVGRINQYDFFDVDTQQRGPLLGNSTAARVRESMYRVLQGRADGVSTQYQYLRDVGITVGSDGQLKFDQAKFDAAIESDPDAVANLFNAFEATAAGTEEIAPGVTVQQTEQSVTARGFGELFGDLMDDLTNSIDGVLTLADRNFKDQIELVTKRISDFDLRLEAKRQRLQNQFTAMEVALAKLQSQGNSLQSLAGNVFMAQSQGM